MKIRDHDLAPQPINPLTELIFILELELHRRFSFEKYDFEHCKLLVHSTNRGGSSGRLDLGKWDHQHQFILRGELVVEDADIFRVEHEYLLVLIFGIIE